MFFDPDSTGLVVFVSLLVLLLFFPKIIKYICCKIRIYKKYKKTLKWRKNPKLGDYCYTKGIYSVGFYGTIASFNKKMALVHTPANKFIWLDISELYYSTLEENKKKQFQKLVIYLYDYNNR